MAKREITIWDILFWIAMLILIIYIIAKLLGIINTPEWLNLLPVITLAFAIVAFYQRLIVFMDKMTVRTDHFKKSIDSINKNINNIDYNINKKINNINSKLTEQDKRLFATEKQQETFNKLLTIKK